MNKIAIALIVALGTAGVVVAGVRLAADHDHVSRTVREGAPVDMHGGGLDSCGGHWNRKLGTYHYHRGPYC